MYLCIDTISSAAGITLATSDSVTYLPLDPQNSSESIVPAIDQALKKGKCTLSDLQGVFVIRGPGSFTGLRVGLSVANQFAHQLKIPVIGLRTDEWWLARSSEPTATYLQSMNKAEVYVSQGEKGIIKNLETLAPCVWLGQLGKGHRETLSGDFREIKNIASIENTWQKIVHALTLRDANRATYELVEPFYGKEPNITKGERQISI